MGFTKTRSVRASDGSAASATMGVNRMLVRLTALVRLTSGVVGAIVAACMAASAANPGLVLAGGASVLLWSCWFAHRVLRPGPHPVLVEADLGVVVLLLLVHPWLVPPEIREFSAGTGWVDVFAGAGVLVAQVGLR